MNYTGLSLLIGFGCLLLGGILGLLTAIAGDSNAIVRILSDIRQRLDRR